MSEKQSKQARESQMESRTMKKRSDGRTTNIATLDNGTMVESFKFLNYCQLAKKSLVSKRYRDLIRGNRHSMAILYVNSLIMSNSDPNDSPIRIFDQELSSEAYNEWVIRNGYWKQIPLEYQTADKQSAQNGDEVYVLSAFYKDSIVCQYSDSTFAFLCAANLNHEHWPLFQHFVRLLMDPFVYIRLLKLIPQNDVLTLLAGAINSDRGRLQCEKLKFCLSGDVPKFINWMKNHIFCDEILIEGDIALNHDEELLDILTTGAHCTSAINMGFYYSAKVIVEFVQKFMDLKSSDKYHMVESIRGETEYQEIIEVLKRDLAELSVKEKRDEEDDITEHVFAFVNNDVGKKLQLTIKILDLDDEFVLKINNL